MKCVILMPSDTGRPGGKRTGQKMSDYPIENGAFYLQCMIFSQIELTEAYERENMAKRKTVYLCQSCGDRARGKPTLDLWCGKCKIALVKVENF